MFLLKKLYSYKVNNELKKISIFDQDVFPNEQLSLSVINKIISKSYDEKKSIFECVVQILCMKYNILEIDNPQEYYQDFFSYMKRHNIQIGDD